MKAVLTLIFVAFASVAHAQEGYPVGTPAYVRWGIWSTQEIADRQLVRVDLQVDGVFMADVPALLPMPAEYYEYRIPQALLAIGPHLVRGRPCSLTVCGDWLEIALTYTSLSPGLLKQFQIHIGDAPLAIDDAVVMVRAYGALFGYRVTDADLIVLAPKFTPPITRRRVLTFLDTEITKLVKE